MYGQNASALQVSIRQDITRLYTLLHMGRSAVSLHRRRRNVALETEYRADSLSVLRRFTAGIYKVVYVWTELLCIADIYSAGVSCPHLASSGRHIRRTADEHLGSMAMIQKQRSTVVNL